MVEEVAGSSEVAASKDEVSDVKRSLKILAELGFLEIDEEGNVSIPAGLKDGDDGAKSSPDGQSQDSEDGEEQVDRPLTEFNEENGEPQETVERVRSQSMSQSRLAVDVDISMDVTEMKTNEVKEKLETINDVLGEHEE